jgi:predicted metal-dependent peptidase
VIYAVKALYQRALKEAQLVCNNNKENKQYIRILKRSTLCSELLCYMKTFLAGIESSYGSKITKRSYTKKNVLFPKLPGVLKRKKIIHTLALCIDESGSMADFEIQRVISGINDLLTKKLIHVKKLRVFTHDTDVSELDINNLCAYKRSHRGGTSHKKIVQKLSMIKNKSEKLSCAIFITDGESDIQNIDFKKLTKVNKLWLLTSKKNVGLLKERKNLGHVVDVSRHVVL